MDSELLAVWGKASFSKDLNYTTLLFAQKQIASRNVDDHISIVKATFGVGYFGARECKYLQKYLVSRLKLNC